MQQREGKRKEFETGKEGGRRPKKEHDESLSFFGFPALHPHKQLSYRAELEEREQLRAISSGRKGEGRKGKDDETHGGVGDLVRLLVHRDVEVDSDKNSLSLEGDVLDGKLGGERHG